nr:defensin-like protein [Ipomoea batatas]
MAGSSRSIVIIFLFLVLLSSTEMGPTMTSANTDKKCYGKSGGCKEEKICDKFCRSKAFGGGKCSVLTKTCCCE